MSLDSNAVPLQASTSAVPALPHDMSRDLGPWQFVVSQCRTLASVFVLLVAASVFLSWPQVLRMDSVPDEGDPLLNTWALSWVGHQLAIAPARLVHANIFYPERYTLLYSESLILPGVIFAPLQHAGVHPVVIYNLSLGAGVVFSGVGLALLVLELTGDRYAAAIAAIAFACLPFRFAHYAHLQLQQTQWIPLALWALHRTIRRGRLSDATLLGVFSAFQLMSCVYFGLLLFPFMMAVGAVVVATHLRLRTTPDEFSVCVGRSFAFGLLRSLVVAGVTFAVLAVPLGSAYVRASHIVGERGPDEVMAGSAVPSDYLAAPQNSVMYGSAADREGGPERRLFPGLTLVVLAVIGVVRRRSVATVAYIVALVVAVDISFGLRGVTFPLLWEHVGVFHGLRIPARMGLFVGLALSVLAAFGVAGLRSREASRRTQQLVAAIGIVLLVVENRVVLNGGQSMSGQMPPAYEAILGDLAGAPATAIADLPIAASMPTYMYYSVFHWQNLLSGYSGFFPPSFVELTRSLEHFPDVVSMDALRRRGARYVVVHGEVLRPEDYAAIVSKADADADLMLLSKSAWRGGEMSVYKIVMANADRP